MKMVNVINLDRPLPERLKVGFCNTYFCRLKGLMFKRSLGNQDGLLLVNKTDDRVSAAIHMLFVFMDLGIVWINSDYKVVDVIHARSWHLIYFPQNSAKYILEIIPDRLKEFSVNEKLEFQHA
jgi:uncharacterized protein